MKFTPKDLETAQALMKQMCPLWKPREISIGEPPEGADDMMTIGEFTITVGDAAGHEGVNGGQMYLVEAWYQIGGTHWEPPDWDSVEIGTFNSFLPALVAVVGAYWEDAAMGWLEGYLYQAEEIPEATPFPGPLEGEGE